jgi:hypothetical protein
LAHEPATSQNGCDGKVEVLQKPLAQSLLAVHGSQITPEPVVPLVPELAPEVLVALVPVEPELLEDVPAVPVLLECVPVEPELLECVEPVLLELECVPDEPVEWEPVELDEPDGVFLQLQPDPDMANANKSAPAGDTRRPRNHACAVMNPPCRELK